MVKKVATFDVPFDEDGNQMSYPQSWGRPIVWKQNDPFEDTLIFKGTSRGRSSVGFEFQRESTGKTINMFLADFTLICPMMTLGRITGTFRHVKRGENYGTALLEK